MTASSDSANIEGSSRTTYSTVASASKLLTKWARVKSARQTTLARLQRSGKALRGLVSSERQATRGAAVAGAVPARRASMRSSWLFRQRAAGRVSRKEEGGSSRTSDTGHNFCLTRDTRRLMRIFPTPISTRGQQQGATGDPGGATMR